MDWFAAPHRDPYWLKALISTGGSILVVTLFHVLTESRVSILYPLLLGGTFAFAGTLCQRGVSSIRSHLKEKRQRPAPTAAQALDIPRVNRSIPPVLKTKREIGPLSQKKRTDLL